MTKKELLDYYQWEYSYFKNEIDEKNNKLACFYNYIPDAYMIAKLRITTSRMKRISNAIKSGATRIAWPVIGHLNTHPACSFYDADNKLLDIQEKMVSEYKNRLDTLVDIVDEDNVSTIYPLMRTTLDCFYTQFALVDRVSLKMRETMTDTVVEPIDYTRFDLPVFLEFFDGVIESRKPLDDRAKAYNKLKASNKGS